jgi:adiponectin receptor
MSARQRKPPRGGTVIEAAKTAEKKVENVLTVLWADLPSWQQDNHYIHSGYRPASGSFQKSFASLGYLHNESVNIYSHLIGAVVFTTAGVLLYALIKPRYVSASISDIIAFGCFFAGAALCLGMSGTYHTISNHSPIVALEALFQASSMASIVILISRSCTGQWYVLWEGCARNLMLM